VFERLSAAIVTRLAQWDRGAAFAAVRTDWLSRAAGVGKPVRVKSGEADLSGVFEGIDTGGRLVLRLADGTMQTLAAGDVSMTAR
jgi:BirA family biotin operon repressor/biotin-[acetyl-CoA-carboxylase] ligase